MRFDQRPPEPFADAVGFLLTWNGRRIAHQFSAALAPLDLRPQHFGVLNLIAAKPGSTQQELVDGSMIDASTMVAVVDELEARGLAERRVHPTDRRKRSVHLTDAGQETLARAREAANRTAEETLAPLDEGERETLKALLRKL